MRLADGSLRTMHESRQAFPDFDVTRSWDMTFPPVQEGDEDLESYLRRIGFTDAQLDYTQRGFAGAAAEAMRSISAASAVDEMQDESCGVGDYRVTDGYDALHTFWAQGLDIRLNTVVTSINTSGEGVVVSTADGQTFTADNVLITLPLGVLQSGRVAFTPELPAEKQAAIARLKMGPIIKMVYRFETPVLPPGIMALYSALNPCMWWSPTYGSDADHQVITAFVTGDRARALLELGEDGALAQGLDVLAEELGREVPTPSATRLVNWVDDPYSLGGYSVTPPGAIDAHAALAQPTEGKLFWAGEATAGHLWKATVHGALASGLRAASEIVTQNRLL